ncbi:MAG TPA: hypothetical protein VN032_13080, partial [Thermoanaerobaculia bacterium]|nr:hypothetical protein [Thermoanaerobaculia bacterium]
ALAGGEAVAPATAPLGPAGRGAAGLSAVCVLAALVATLAGAASSVDLFYFWGPKAQQFAIARGVDFAFLAEPFHGYMHAYYPPLVAGLDALATIAAGRFSWTSATLTFPLLLAALAVALPGVLRGAAARPAAAAAAALAVASVTVIGIRANIAGTGDMPLYLFESLAMALLMRKDATDAAVQILAGLLLAGAAAAKVEGLPFALAAAALFLILRRAEPRETVRSAARLVLPTAAALGAWFAFGATRHLFGAYSEYGPLLALHAEHWPSIATGIPRVIFSTGRALPYAVPLMCLLATGRLGPRAILPLGTAAAILAFVVFTYFHLVADPSQWITWSAARILAPIPLLFALATATGVRDAAASSPP